MWQTFLFLISPSTSLDNVHGIVNNLSVMFSYHIGDVSMEDMKNLTQ